MHVEIPPPGKNQRLLELVGLHPLVGYGLVAIDVMLFGAGGPVLGTVGTVAAGLGLILPAALIQRHGMGESWGLALGKAALAGLLTAIPTPLPSVIPLLAGYAGQRLLTQRRAVPGETKP